MRQFFKQTLASFIGSCAGLIFFFLLGTSGLFLLFLSIFAGDSAPKVENKSFLVFNLSTSIKDTEPVANLSDSLSGKNQNKLTLTEVLDCIDKATKDPKISGIFLDGRGESSSTGYANLKEIRAALQKFKASGKKIVAYNVDWSEGKYYLASVADRILINPMGSLEINGFSSEQSFLAGAFKKYGVDVQIVRVGQYKSAVEPFTRENFSPESRAQTQALLNDLWSDFLFQVGESRQIPPNYLKSIADQQGLVNAEVAKGAKLVDELAYFDNAVSEIKQLTGDKDKNQESFAQMQMADYLQVYVPEAKNRSSNNKIAVVFAEGTIVDGKGEVQEIGSDIFIEQLRQIRQDDDIKAVVLRINSPGGSATASEVILRELQLTQEKKPVIVSMGNMAASGGYWIATGSDRIFAQNNTITGSIGVFGLLPNIQKIGNNNGVKWDSVKTGPLADLDSVVRPKTPQELAIYQQSVERIYNLFLAKVSKSRNLSTAKVAEIAQGRVWSGKEALKIGLVDEIGGINEAIAYAAQKAELKDDWQVEEFQKDRTLEQEILQRLLGSQTLVSSGEPLTKELAKLTSDLSWLKSFKDPQGIYARLPFSFLIK